MLPPDWATLKQPAPQNHGTPAIDALRPGQPLRALLGDFLSEAAIARAEVGRATYGSLLTPHNGRDQAVDALQELADAAVYLAAAYVEAPIRNGIEDSDKNSTWADTEERALLRWAIKKISEAEELIKDATVWRAKRIAAEAQPTDLERLLRHEAENESEVQP